MLDALNIFYTFVLCGAWRTLTMRWLEQTGWWVRCERVRMVLHYYTIAFGCFIILVVDNVTSTFQALFSYGFADPEKFLIHPENVAQLHPCHDNSTVTPLNWSMEQKVEVRFDSHGVMRCLVLGACPAVVFTQLVGWWHIGRHWKRIMGSETARLQDNILRDRAIQIMLLPVIYSVVAYNNVIRLMNLFTGAIDLCRDEWTLNFEEKKAYTLSLYEANLSMADFYEAIALYHFTALAVNHIKWTFIRQKQKEEGFSRSKTIIEGFDPVIRVTGVMSGLVMSGVMSFCITCLLTFARGLHLVFSIAFYKQVVQANAEGSLPAMLSGAGFVASTVAIANVVNVELEFHHELKVFKPSKKFWSTKIIVSIAYIQEIALGILGNATIMGEHRKLSELQINLLYCSLLCYEVFVVALLHVFAWPPDATITSGERKMANSAFQLEHLGETEYWQEQAVEAREPLLCVE